MSPDPNSAWGTNPYPGRKIIRELHMQEGECVCEWMDERKSQLIDAYCQVFAYIHPGSSESERMAWAVQRFDHRREEIRSRLFGATNKGLGGTA